MEPFAYLCQIPGKDIRSRMIDAYNHWLKVDPRILDLVKKVVTMLHNGSLLYTANFGFGCVSVLWSPLLTNSFRVARQCRVDDIEDHSKMRRGQPGKNRVFFFCGKNCLLKQCFRTNARFTEIFVVRVCVQLLTPSTESR
jgi:geranylgeranyl diphosphate synthase type 3